MTDEGDTERARVLLDWQELKSYVSFNADDEQRLGEALPFVEQSFSDVAEVFYAAVLRFPRAAVVLENEEQTVRLKKTLTVWMRELFAGPFDEAYFERRKRIGRVHVQVGLPERYMFSAITVVRTELSRIIYRTMPLEIALPCCISMSKILDLDLATMTSTYMTMREQKGLESLPSVIVDSLPLTVVCLNEAGLVMAATRDDCLREGFVLGKPFKDVVLPDLWSAADLGSLLRFVRETGQAQGRPRVRAAGLLEGRYFRISVLPTQHSICRLLVQIEEFTSAVRDEARLQHSESLARVGTLAANLAHEIRNPLAAISSTLQVIEGGFEPLDPRCGIIGSVLGQVSRLDELVGDLLGYSRHVEPLMVSFVANSLVRDVVERADSTARVIELETIGVFADANALTQILINLLQNARHAAGHEGVVVVEVGPGPLISVSDNGVGVEKDAANQIFEPFVTSKREGTGLGLAISRKLAKSMDGSLLLDGEKSDLGGACFRLHLQASRKVHAFQGDSEGCTG